ncbi:DUF397 domain-containing protein [Streptomyces sp. NBC_01456]|uniref:DUF397 domain-containing protein n=1 Tax=unclassified Streptomyces TaxID=2593676 RepID=UPI002E342321|nr:MULTISPECIES: DUF397 domain-containing protein [unclassified Streptomyces]
MGYDLSGIAWRKSSYSSANGQCVEVADGLPGIVPVRDSKHPAGPSLAFGARAWTSFLAKLKADHPTAF